VDKRGWRQIVPTLAIYEYILTTTFRKGKIIFILTPPSELFMILVGDTMALSGIPQISRLRSRRSADDISLVMFSIILFGQACWTWYGIAHSSPSLIITNVLGFIINSMIIILSIRFRKS
jgi:MtN3 and saliva related transmembrane protein